MSRRALRARHCGSACLGGRTSRSQREYPVYMRSVWKWIGLAGVAGVVAGGALVVRDQRKRRAYTADEVRARLHQRLAESDAPDSTANKR